MVAFTHKIGLDFFKGPVRKVQHTISLNISTMDQPI